MYNRGSVMNESPFQAELLNAAQFPVLDKLGQNASQHEIKIWGFSQFLKDGWLTLESNDSVLNQWLERLIRTEIVDYGSRAETISRSIRYGAAIIYYPLYLQAENSNGQFILPKANFSQEGSLRFDLGQNEQDSMGEFLVSFDENLAAVLGGFIKNSQLLKTLDITKDEVYLGAWFTYFALANRAESQGMAKKFKEL